jgi:hypothetical protein
MRLEVTGRPRRPKQRLDLCQNEKAGPCRGAGASNSNVREPSGIAEATRPIKPHNDDAGEDDLAYFAARPWARTRVRLAFVGEFPRKVMKLARGRDLVVLVAVERDAAGRPTTRGRGVYFVAGGDT